MRFFSASCFHSTHFLIPLNFLPHQKLTVRQCYAAWDILLWGQEPSAQTGLQLSAAAVVVKGELAFSQPFYSLWAFWKALRAKYSWLDSFCLYALVRRRPDDRLPHPPPAHLTPWAVSLPPMWKFCIDTSRQRDQRHLHGAAWWPFNPQRDEWMRVESICLSGCLRECAAWLCQGEAGRVSNRPRENSFHY